MSVRWESPKLFQPITEDKPCGESLEDTELLASFDGFRVFGQARPLDAPAEPDEKRIPKPLESPEWIEIRDKSLEALAKSKDLRLLAYLGTAVLRTDGLQAFAETLRAASQWLEMYWSQTYPLVDEDAVLRRNALNCFADSMAVVDALRRVPLVRSRQHGTFSLRDVDIATNQLAPSEGDSPADEAQIHEAFSSMPIAELSQLLESVVGAIASLNKIDGLMRDAAGSEALPGFEPVVAVLGRTGQALRPLEKQRNRTRRLVAPEKLSGRIERADRVLPGPDCPHRHDRRTAVYQFVGRPSRSRSVGMRRHLRADCRRHLLELRRKPVEVRRHFGARRAAHRRIDRVDRRHRAGKALL